MKLTVLLANIKIEHHKIIFQKVMTEDEVNQICKENADIKLGTKTENDIFFFKTHFRVHGVEYIPVYRVDKDYGIYVSPKIDEVYRPLEYDSVNDVFYDAVRYDKNQIDWDVDKAMLGSVNPGCYYLRLKRLNRDDEEIKDYPYEQDIKPFRIMVLPSSLSLKDYKIMIEDILDIRADIAIAENGLQSHNAEYNLKKVLEDLLKIRKYLKEIEFSGHKNLYETLQKESIKRIKKYNGKVIRELCKSDGKNYVKQPVRIETNNIYENRIMFFILCKLEEKLNNKFLKSDNANNRIEKKLYTDIKAFLQLQLSEDLDYIEAQNKLKNYINKLNDEEEKYYSDIEKRCLSQSEDVNEVKLLGVKLNRSSYKADFTFENNSNNYMLRCIGWENRSRNYNVFINGSVSSCPWGNSNYCKFLLKMKNIQEYGFLYGILCSYGNNLERNDGSSSKINSYSIYFRGFHHKIANKNSEFDDITFIINEILCIEVDGKKYDLVKFFKGAENPNYSRNIERIREQYKEFCRTLYFREFDDIFMKKHQCQSYLNKLNNSDKNNLALKDNAKSLKKVSDILIQIKKCNVFKHLPLKNEGWKNTQIFLNDKYYSKIAKILKNIDKNLGITDEPNDESIILRKADRLYEFWIFCKMVDILQKELGWVLKGAEFFVFQKEKGWMQKEEEFSQKDNLKFKDVINQFFKINNVYSEGIKIILQRKVELFDLLFNISISYNHSFAAFNDDKSNNTNEFRKFIRPDFCFEAYITDKNDNVICDKTKIYLDAKYRNYQDQGIQTFYEDVIDVALVKYMQNFYSKEIMSLDSGLKKQIYDEIKKNFPKASFIIHSDYNENMACVNFGGSFENQFVRKCFERYDRYCNEISKSIYKHLKGYPKNHKFELPFWNDVKDYIDKKQLGLMPANHLIGGFPFYPSNTGHFKTFILLVFEYFFYNKTIFSLGDKDWDPWSDNIFENISNGEALSDEDSNSNMQTWNYCWKCGCLQKAKMQSLKTKRGYYKYYLLCNCGEFWVKTHCQYQGHPLIKHSSENYHHNILGKENDNWYVACPTCGDGGIVYDEFAE